MIKRRRASWLTRLLDLFRRPAVPREPADVRQARAWGIPARALDADELGISPATPGDRLGDPLEAPRTKMGRLR